MAETTAPTGPTAGAGTPPPVDTGTPTVTPPADAGAANGRTFNQTELNTLLAKERKDTEQRLKDEAETARQTAQGEYKTLLEKEQANHKAAQEELRRLRTETAGRDLAATVGIRADRARQAMALVAGQVQYDKDGNPTNLEDLLKGVLKDMPEWAAADPKTPVRNGAPTNPAKPPTSTGTFTRSQLRDPVFYQANKAAIQLAANEGRIVED